MKKIISLFLAALMLLMLGGCGEKGESSTSGGSSSEASDTLPERLDTECRIFALNGPTGMGLAPLMKKAEEKTGRLDYTITTVGSNDEIVAKLSNGEADIAAIATNLASTLYKKLDGEITVLTANTLGVLCLVSKGEELTDLASLKGKTVYATGQGANPEYIINYLLEKNGLKVGADVTLEFVSQPTELVTKFTQNEKAIAIAPQPVATTITVKCEGAKIVLDMNDEWEKVTDTKLVMGCAVVRNEYLRENPQAVEIFLEEYESSVKTVNTDAEAAAELCEKYGITASAAIAKKALPYCNIVFESGAELKRDLSAYLDFLYKANPQSVGGAVPSDAFYYAAN